MKPTLPSVQKSSMQSNRDKPMWTLIVNKRSMASGYGKLDNELFYVDKTMMGFGDAKKEIQELVKTVD